ncbi:MAG: hypothetical protein KatS3mg059_0915 [Thermomicrobiales bacterium]|nr:MAG: hypothetical protein KatS3mg059_0915 [Thermomicrobiales bacterium]
MATTVTQAFNEYKSNLEISDWQASRVSTRRENVVKALSAKLSLHPDQPSLVIGSWDRRTLTRYLSEGDVDVMVPLHYDKHKDWDSAEGTIKALDRFRAILQDAYPDNTLRRDRNCITIQFSEFRLDVAPAFRNTGGYYRIPDSIRQLWVPTNPFKFAEKVTERNKTMGYTFVPLIKMVKGWNRDECWPIRSFHLECLMLDYFRTYTKGYSYPFMLRSFFEALPTYLRNAIYDPVMGDRVDTYLDNNASPTKRQIAIEKAEAAAAAAKEAYEDQDKYISVAINEWQKLLGEFFPKYG